VLYSQVKERTRVIEISYHNGTRRGALALRWRRELVQEQPDPSQEQREGQYVALVAQAHVLGLRYARAKAHACQALAKRLLGLAASLRLGQTGARRRAR